MEEKLDKIIKLLTETNEILSYISQKTKTETSAKNDVKSEIAKAKLEAARKFDQLKTKIGNDMNISE